MLLDLSSLEQLAQTKIIHAGIVGNGGQVFHALADQGVNQVGGNAAQPESSDQEHCAVLNIADGLISAGNDFIHKQMILTHSPSIRCLSRRFPSGQSPRPDSPFTCPAGPISTKRLPQARANSRARSGLRYGSLRRNTTIKEKGSRSCGTGASP